MQTYSIPKITRELQCDARRITRALDGVPADATTAAGGKRWSLQTAASALRNHGHSLTGSSAPRSNGDNGSGRNRSDLDRAVDALEHAAAALEDALSEVAAEPNIKKRRERAKTIGPLRLRKVTLLRRAAGREVLGQSGHARGLHS